MEALASQAALAAEVEKHGELHHLLDQHAAGLHSDATFLQQALDKCDADMQQGWTSRKPKAEAPIRVLRDRSLQV